MEPAVADCVVATTFPVSTFVRCEVCLLPFEPQFANEWTGLAQCACRFHTVCLDMVQHDRNLGQADCPICLLSDGPGRASDVEPMAATTPVATTSPAPTTPGAALEQGGAEGSAGNARIPEHAGEGGSARIPEHADLSEPETVDGNDTAVLVETLLEADGTEPAAAPTATATAEPTPELATATGTEPAAAPTAAAAAEPRALLATATSTEAATAPAAAFDDEPTTEPAVADEPAAAAAAEPTAEAAATGGTEPAAVPTATAGAEGTPEPTAAGGTETATAPTATSAQASAPTAAPTSPAFSPFEGPTPAGPPTPLGSEHGDTRALVAAPPEDSALVPVPQYLTCCRCECDFEVEAVKTSRYRSMVKCKRCNCIDVVP